MAMDEPSISQPYGDTTMADTNTVYQPIPQSNDGMFGGGTLGAVLLGGLLPRMLGNGGYGYGMGAEMMNGGLNGTNQILQALNQGQNATSTQIITQDVNRLSHDVATSAAATQATVAGANLQQTVATLQGQTALTKDIMDSTITNAAGHTNILSTIAASNADTNNNLYNIRQGISSDINEATRVLDMDIHSLGSTLERNIEGVRNDVNTARYETLNSAHQAEINAMRNAFDNQRAVYDTANQTQKLILEDGSKTRDLINANEVATLNRIILEERDRRHADRTISDLTITNNNNANALNSQMQGQLQAQQQQQQLAGLTTGLAILGAQIQTATQTTVNTGTMGNNGLSAVQV
jgi:hypothetical protein